MRRREFLIKSAGAGAAALTSICYSCAKDDPKPKDVGDFLTIDLDLPEYSVLNTEGNSVIVELVIIANRGDENFVALSSVCTHRGCDITYNHAAGDFPCPCHGSIFAADGTVKQGPASFRIDRFLVTRDGNVLTVHLKELI